MICLHYFTSAVALPVMPFADLGLGYRGTCNLRRNNVTSVSMGVPRGRRRVTWAGLTTMTTSKMASLTRIDSPVR
jgi:hypothetical protein